MLLSRKITIGALSTSLIILFAFFKYIFPAADLTFFVLASFCISIAVILTGLNGGVLTYLSSSALMFAIFGIFFALPFIIFFGIYPILKALIEKNFENKISYTVKILIFASISTIVVLLSEELAEKIDINFYAFFEKISFFESFYDFRIFILIPLLIVFLTFYDLILSSLITFFSKRILPNLKNR